MVNKVVEDMVENGVRFLNKSSPSSFEKLESGKILAKWVTKGEAEGETAEHSEEFDTVLMAVGRTPDTQDLGLEKAGLELKWGRVKVDEHNQSEVDSIYAIGDVIVDSPELTPVAIREGIFLADHLYGGVSRTINYDLIATTIFTPLEYGCIGYSEEKAIEK